MIQLDFLAVLVDWPLLLRGAAFTLGLTAVATVLGVSLGVACTRARTHGRALARETPIGWMPKYEDMEWSGLNFPKEKFEKLQVVDRNAWRAEVVGHEELFIELHDRLPPETIYERELLICRL